MAAVIGACTALAAAVAGCVVVIKRRGRNAHTGAGMPADDLLHEAEEPLSPVSVPQKLGAEKDRTDAIHV